MSLNYELKYKKYKNKYIQLKEKLGGVDGTINSSRRRPAVPPPTSISTSAPVPVETYVINSKEKAIFTYFKEFEETVNITNTPFNNNQNPFTVIIVKREKDKSARMKQNILHYYKILLNNQPLDEKK